MSCEGLGKIKTCIVRRKRSAKLYSDPPHRPASTRDASKEGNSSQVQGAVAGASMQNV